jgi:hypothetical protein
VLRGCLPAIDPLLLWHRSVEGDIYTIEESQLHLV